MSELRDTQSIQRQAYADGTVLSRNNAQDAPEPDSADNVSWKRTLAVGLVLYVIGLIIYALTENLNLIPGLILLGAFLVPVTYVAFFYQHRRRSSVSLPTVALAFVYGGFLGSFAAAVLEAIYANGIFGIPLRGIALAVVFFLGVGLIEEFAKLLGVVVVARRARHAAEIDGIIIGAAAGMGFAALESSGYVFTAFIASHGSLTEAVVVTTLRGVLAPVGHGTWTAIIASVMFREAVNGHLRVNGAVVMAYLTASILHMLWDASEPIAVVLAPDPSSVGTTEIILAAIIGATGLFVLWMRWREAVRRQDEAVQTDSPVRRAV